MAAVKKSVFIWDMDDSILPWDMLQKSNNPAKTALFSRMHKVVDFVQEKHLYREQHKHFDVGSKVAYHINALHPTKLDMGVLDNIRQKYERTSDPSQLFTVEFYRELSDIRNTLEAMFPLWQDTSTRILQILHAHPHAENYIVSNARFLPTLGKLLTFGFNPYVRLDNIYSTFLSPRGKIGAFQIISSQNPGAQFLVLGDGRSEMEASANFQYPFVHLRKFEQLGPILTLLQPEMPQRHPTIDVQKLAEAAMAGVKSPALEDSSPTLSPVRRSSSNPSSPGSAHSDSIWSLSSKHHSPKAPSRRRSHYLH
eukprot:Rmarinus@m.28287